MHNNIVFPLAADNVGMSTVDRLVNIYHLLSQVLHFQVEGDVVELGCNSGKTSIFLQMLIDEFDSQRKLHVYDSFEGLPKPGEKDAYLKEGECDCTVEDLKNVFDKWNKKYPLIYKGWFKDTLPSNLPDKICFAYLDSDFYDPILFSLESIYDRLEKNAIVVIDDYCDNSINKNAWPGLPGVKVACDEFFQDKEESISVLVANSDLSYGYFRKK